jgi:hypothetical protein
MSKRNTPIRNANATTDSYIYVRHHPSYDPYDAVKLGVADVVPDRDSTYATNEIERGVFVLVIRVPRKKSRLIENAMQTHFHGLGLHVYRGGGTEFYNKSIVHMIVPYLSTLNTEFALLTQEEIVALKRASRVKQSAQKIRPASLLKVLRQMGPNRYAPKPEWVCRDYQTALIEYATAALHNESKIYIELATGGGKSYIVYNIFKRIESKVIVILSPRKIVNKQNVCAEYVSILGSDVEVFNYSTDHERANVFIYRDNKNHETQTNKTNKTNTNKTNTKQIIIACTQSADKLYELILKHNLTNIDVWFDEAHWGIEEWCKDETQDEPENKSKRFWLLDKTRIHHRVFTSASPDKELVKNNPDIFGQLYKPVTVRQLMDDGWLCPIKPYIFCANSVDANWLQFMLDGFVNGKKTFGFSFHNKQQNACNLFYKHYVKYAQGDTHIRPFLLVGDDFGASQDKRLTSIALPYDYRAVTEFEKYEESLAYVVAKYSMGYDFKKLDFECISDPKMSVKDIKQSIGRGLRPDKLGPQGKNQDKVLKLMLPVFIDESEEEGAKGNKYSRIIEVLKYLVYNIEISVEQLVFEYASGPSGTGGESLDSNGYNGTAKVGEKVLDVLRNSLKNSATTLSPEEFVRLLRKNRVHNAEDYYVFKEKRIDIALPAWPHITYEGFGWVNTYTYTDAYNLEQASGVEMFYSKEECIAKLKQLRLQWDAEGDERLDNMEDDEDKEVFLNQIDKKIPKQCLWKFYGGKRGEYMY